MKWIKLEYEPDDTVGLLEPEWNDFGWTGTSKPDVYRPHPDRNQERLFFSLVRECLEKGVFDADLVRREMAANHVRHDALDLCQRLAA